MKNDLKADMEGLTNLIQEMFPNGENLVEETHDENKINVNLDFINSDVGLKTHHITNIDMRKFHGKDLVTWILQMEQYFEPILCKTHKSYALQLYIWKKIHLYGIDGFAPVKKLSLGQFLRRK